MKGHNHTVLAAFSCSIAALLMGCADGVKSLDGSTKPMPEFPNGALAAGPPALSAPEPQIVVPPEWPFPEAFPRTSGFGRLYGGALYWSDFLYDDHGALGNPSGDSPVFWVSPPVGTYRYPDGAAHNGADMAGAAIGLTEDSVWFRVDWNTLEDLGLPVAMWAFDTDNSEATGSAVWPAGAGVHSPGIEQWLLVSGQGAWIVDNVDNRLPVTSLGGEVWTDLASRTFIVRLPRSFIGNARHWRVRLVSGLANEPGDSFAPVPVERGRLPGQPAVYNVAFRTDAQELSGSDNWWRDKKQALALASGDIGVFSLLVDWSELEDRTGSPEPQPTGWTNRWYFSSIELGPGISPSAPAFRPNYLGQRQPYGIYVPSSPASIAGAPLTILLHSLNINHNQYNNLNPEFIKGLCEDRGSICVAPMGRGPNGWWANEAELDVWEVWSRVAMAYELDHTRTVLAGYSMGGYGAYRLGLSHPDLFASVIVLAGAPACSIRIMEGIEFSVDGSNRECDDESDTSLLVENARELPFYIGHGALDELAPVSSAIEQADRFDTMGYRHRIEIYPNHDHVTWVTVGEFEGAVAWLQQEERKLSTDPPRITYTWYAQHQRDDLGIGPGKVWWVSGLHAASDIPGFKARIDVTSRALLRGATTIERFSETIFNADGIAAATELRWITLSPDPDRESIIDAKLKGVAEVTLDVERAGLRKGEGSTLRVITDGLAKIGLIGLQHGTLARTKDGQMIFSDASGRLTINVPIGETVIEIGR